MIHAIHLLTALTGSISLLLGMLIQRSETRSELQALRAEHRLAQEKALLAEQIMLYAQHECDELRRELQDQIAINTALSFRHFRERVGFVARQPALKAPA